jgi:nitric oxide reductase subunit B
MRMPGDVILIVGGVLPFLWITWLGIRHGIKAKATTMPPETLYVEETPEAAQDRTGIPVPAHEGGSGEVPRSRTRYGSDGPRDPEPA